MTIGAGKSAGRLATTRDSASMPPAEEPITTNCASAAFVGTLPHSRTHRRPRGVWRIAARCRVSILAHDCTPAYVRRDEGLGATRSPSHVAARQATLGPPWLVAPTLASDRRRTTRPPAGSFVTFVSRALSGQITKATLSGVPGQVRNFILTAPFPTARSSVLQDQMGRPSAPSLSGSWCPPSVLQAPRRRNMTNQKARGFIAPGIAPEGDGIPHSRRVPR